MPSPERVELFKTMFDVTHVHDEAGHVFDLLHLGERDDVHLIRGQRLIHHDPATGYQHTEMAALVALPAPPAGTAWGCCCPECRR